MGCRIYSSNHKPNDPISQNEGLECLSIIRSFKKIGCRVLLNYLREERIKPKSSKIDKQ